MRSGILTRPSALVPLAMSLVALAMVLVHAALFGVVRQADEGTAAHVFQLLLVAQLPLVLYFAAQWLPRAPGPAIRVLMAQAGAWLSAVLAAYWLT